MFKKRFLKLAHSMITRIDINFIVDYLLVLIQGCSRFPENNFSTYELNCYFLKDEKGSKYEE